MIQGAQGSSDAGDQQAQSQAGAEQQPAQGDAQAKPDAGETPKYGNIEPTPENIAELASTRDRLREKNRELAEQLAEFQSARQQAEEQARLAAEEKAKAEGDWKTLFEQRAQEIDQLKSELEEWRGKADAMVAAQRKRDVMDVILPELRDGVSRFLVEAALDGLESRGVVTVNGEGDPKEIGASALQALAKHSPELLRGSDQGGGAPGQQPNHQPRVDVGRLNRSLADAKVGTLAARILGKQ